MRKSNRLRSLDVQDLSQVDGAGALRQFLVGAAVGGVLTAGAIGISPQKPMIDLNVGFVTMKTK
jgi:hypothetical protein